MQNNSVQNLVPVQAFALAFVLFTTRTLESILAGILITWLLLAAFLLKNILTPHVPAWSRNLSVAVAAAALCWSVFRLTAWFLATPAMPDVVPSFRQTAAVAAQGLLIAHTVLFARRGHESGALLVQSAAVWVVLILTGAVREYLSSGSVLGVGLPASALCSAVFAQPMFGLAAAALALSLFDAPVILFPADGHGPAAGGRTTDRTDIWKKRYAGILKTAAGCSLPVLACLFLFPPVRHGSPSFPVWAAGVLAVLLFHGGVRRRMAYAPSPVSRLPVLLMATSFFYMILTAY